MTKLYGELASWFHLLTAPEDYAEEAAFYSRLFVDASRRPVRTVLELGSGGGNNAFHMKHEFDLTLTDLSESMLALSRTINPECEHILADMRTMRLGRTFDGVFVHDAVSYMATEEDLRAAISTAAAHCAPGGAALFCPDHTLENYRDGTSHGGHDAADRRGLRYLEWTWRPDLNASTYVTDFAYLLRDADGETRVEYDRHVLGLFSIWQWLQWMREAGFDATVVPFDHSEVEPGSLSIFVGVRQG